MQWCWFCPTNGRRTSLTPFHMLAPKTIADSSSSHAFSAPGQVPPDIPLMPRCPDPPASNGWSVPSLPISFIKHCTSTDHRISILVETPWLWCHPSINGTTDWQPWLSHTRRPRTHFYSEGTVKLARFSCHRCEPPRWTGACRFEIASRGMFGFNFTTVELM